MHVFCGRVGLFSNQPGDQLLAQADRVITIGFNCVEYDPEISNPQQNKKLIHINYQKADIHYCYQPEVEILGAIDKNIASLNALTHLDITPKQYCQFQQQLNGEVKAYIKHTEVVHGRIHPIDFIKKLHAYVDQNALLSCDIGSNYMWIARFFYVILLIKFYLVMSSKP